MKVHVEYDSAEERVEFLSFVKYTTQPVTENLDEVEKMLNEQLGKILGQAYAAGAGVKAGQMLAIKAKETPKFQVVEK